MSNTEEALLNAPRLSEQTETEQASGGNNVLSKVVGRVGLSLALAAGAGGLGGLAESAATATPAEASTTFSNDYPDGDATDCSATYGIYSWCKGNPPAHQSPRGFDYRNCTDGVAYWVNKYTGVVIPGSSYGNASNWDNAAPASEVIAGNTNSNIEPGDIAQSDTGGGGLGHVGFVTSVTKNGNGGVTSFTTAEMNKGGAGEYTGPNTNVYSSRDASGYFTRGSGNKWDHFIDVNGPGKGLNGEDLTGGQPSGTTLDFIRLNHSSGNVEVVGYDDAHHFQTLSSYELTSYPDVPPDGNVIPLFKPNGDLSFIRLNYYTGNVQVVTYSKASGYKTLVQAVATGYPDVPGDGAVVPRFKPNGDLSFIRLNHSSGHVEDVTYSAASNYQTMVDYQLTGYPSVTPDGSVVPLYAPNGDLVFIRLNHSSGHVEYTAYSASSGFHTLSEYDLTSYPSVIPDGTVVPLIQPDGDLSFVRLNHSSGHVEDVTYSAGSHFQTMNDYELTAYPTVPADGTVVVRYSN